MDGEPEPVPPNDPDPFEPARTAEPAPGAVTEPLDPVAQQQPGQPEPPGQADQTGEAVASSGPAAGEELVELALASVELAPEGLQPSTGTVSLVDMGGGGRVDIVMARADAALVQEAIARIEPPRPRTHDLLLSAVFALGASVVGVTLVERRAGGIYVANLRVRRQDGTTVELDARPSDALNVALRSTGAVLQAPRSLIGVPSN